MKESLYFLRRIVEDVRRGDNLDMVVALALGFLIAALNILGIASSEWVSSITLVTLGLLAAGLLVMRYRIEDAYDQSQTRDTFRFERERTPSFNHTIANTREIWMLGIVLVNTTSDYFYDFTRLASKGAKIRGLIVDLEKTDIDCVVRRFSRAATKDQFLASEAETIGRFKHFRQTAPTQDSVQLRMLDFVPSTSLYIFPNHDEDNFVYVEIYGYKSPLGSAPRFIVSERKNPEWYKHFLDQYERMWNDAARVEL